MKQETTLFPPTHKQVLYKKWWWTNLWSAVGVSIVIGVIILTGNVQYLAWLIPVIFISRFFGSLKCPRCNESLVKPPGPRGFDSIRYCSKCGFDLDTVIGSQPPSE